MKKELTKEEVAFLWLLTNMNYNLRERGQAEDRWFFADKILMDSGYYFTEGRGLVRLDATTEGQ
jgi:hypothetical protein